MPDPQQLPSHEVYTGRWEQFERASPNRTPDNWREDYHGQPDAAFEQLCARAEAWGMRVFLSINKDRVLGREDEEWHPWDTLIVASHPSQPVLKAYVSTVLPGGLRNAALRLLEKLQDADG